MLKIFVLAMTIALAASQVQAAFTPAIDHRGSTGEYFLFQYGRGPGTIFGNKFTVTGGSNLVVDQLGLWGGTFTSAPNTSVEVFLYEFGAGSALAQATISAANPLSTAVNYGPAGLGGAYFFSSLGSNVTLLQGKSYVIAAQYSSSSQRIASNGVNSFYTDPGITFNFGDTVSIAGSVGTLTFPTVKQNSNAYFTGPTFSVATSAVPEPSSFALMGLGLIGIAGRQWRRKPQID